ncbi:MAG: hypothetical protein Q9160_000743 [Pyrenula sp. 1 TL-2023]
MTSNSHGLSPASIETIAGFSAGVVSTLAVHPLDIIKTRLQLNTLSASQFGSTVAIARSIFRNEGSVRGFYRGLTPNLVGNAAGWSLYFLWYKQLQDLLRKYKYDGSRTVSLTSMDYLATSAAAGILSSALTNPIWVIKTRMLSTSATHTDAYPSMLYGLRSILHEEGVRGYFRGLLPALVGVSNGAFYFVAYEKLKTMRAHSAILSSSQPVGGEKDSKSEKPSTASASLTNTDYLLISASSKIFAGTLTYPHQVLRARLQAYQSQGHIQKSDRQQQQRFSATCIQRTNVDRSVRAQRSASPIADMGTVSKIGGTYTGVVDVVRTTWRHEGLAGFYKGLAPNLIRVVPSTCVTFLVYENARWFLTQADE